MEMRTALVAAAAGLRQVGWFGTIGATATALHYLVLIGLVELLDAGPTVASSAGYVAGGTLNYLLNKRVTFRSPAPGHRAVPRFVAVALVGAAANATVVWFATAILATPYLLAQVIATALVFVWNFLANKHWTFAVVERAGGDTSRVMDRAGAGPRQNPAA
jgi:putative flippase GtrA